MRNQNLPLEQEQDLEAYFIMRASKSSESEVRKFLKERDFNSDIHKLEEFMMNINFDADIAEA